MKAVLGEHLMLRESSGKMVFPQVSRKLMINGSYFGLSINCFPYYTTLLTAFRPEAIESVFILYRITGDPSLQDAAWRMFQAINNSTQTEISNSAIADVTCPHGEETEKLDSCESFWMAETLKYFYLIFSHPGLVSLDEYVL
jgi:hypothetical protein